MNSALFALIILFSIPTFLTFADSENDEDLLFQKGTESFQNFRFNEAISYFDQVLEINPTHLDALSNKGAVLFQLGKHEEAIPYFDQVLEINPVHIGALNNKGAVLVDVGKPVEAIPYFDQVLEINPNELYALSNKVDALFQLNRINEAISTFEQVLDIEPNHTLTMDRIEKYQLSYQQVEGVLEILVHNSEGHLVTYLKSTKIHFLDHPIAENLLNSWPVTEIVTRNGQEFEVHQNVVVMEVDKKSYPGRTGFTIDFQSQGLELKEGFVYKKKLYLVQVFHNVFLIEKGDTITTVYTVFRPTE